MFIHSLKNTSISSLTSAFNDAFSKYLVPIKLTDAALEKMLKIRDVSLEHSFGVFDTNDHLCGFILNGIRMIDGNKVAYNAATGIRIQHQGKGHANQLLQHCKQYLKEIGCTEYRLEVITQNDAAVQLYTRAGFEVQRTLNCYRWETKEAILTSTTTDDYRIEKSKVSTTTFENLMLPNEFQPAWQNEKQSVMNTAEDVRAFRFHKNEHTLATLLMDVTNGSIMQFSYLHQHNRKLQELFARMSQESKLQKLNLVNLDSEDYSTSSFLIASGWEPTVSQYEMRLKWR